MNNKLNRALTNIDESLIEEAVNANCAEHRIRNMAVKIAVPIAAAAAAAGAVLIAQPYRNILPQPGGITLSAGKQDSDNSESQSENDKQMQSEKDNLQTAQENIQSEKDNLQEVREDNQSEKDDLQEIREDIRAQIDFLQSEINSIIAMQDNIAEKIANDELTQSDMDNLQARQDRLQSDKDSLQSDKDSLQSEMDSLQTEVDSLQSEMDGIIAEIERRIEQGERLNSLFGTDNSEEHMVGVSADEYSISSIYFGSFFPEVLMYENDIAVFTDGSDSLLCFYDTADNTPDNERMIARIDLKETVELLQSDPANGILPTIGSEELGDPGIGVAAYKIGEKYELVLRVGSTDGEEKSLQTFNVGMFGSHALFSRCDEVSGKPLERIIQSDEITPALVDGFDMYSLRLVVNKNGKSRVFDPFNEMCEYLPENNSGISIAFARDGLRNKVYLYSTNALKEGVRWYYKGEGFYSDECRSIDFYENGATSVSVNFTENDDCSITITEIIIHNSEYDKTNELAFPTEQLKAGMNLVPAGSAASFEKWGQDSAGA